VSRSPAEGHARGPNDGVYTLEGLMLVELDVLAVRNFLCGRAPCLIAREGSEVAREVPRW
jgi:hypothetical protein